MSVEIIYDCAEYTVCVKPCGVNSQDCPGGMPELLSAATGGGRFFAVHRLDREVGGVMVYAKTAPAAAELTRQIGDGRLSKRYLAVLCATEDALPAHSGRLCDLLYHDRTRNKTYVVKRQRAGVRMAELEYECRASIEKCESFPGGLCLVDVRLLTGRTHQIRVQFASRHAPLLGDAKYGGRRCPAIGLWAYCLGFCDVRTGEPKLFLRLPPEEQVAFANFRTEILTYKEDNNK